MAKHTSGFTLIELSIVLVIIGLIVGGILVGQDLIVSAATRAQLTQIEKYNTAVHTFQTKYGGIPGDLALGLATQFGFAIPTAGGRSGQAGCRDGNGLIDGYQPGGTNQIYPSVMGENALIWDDLSRAGLVDGNYTTAYNGHPDICNAVYYVAGMTLDGILPNGKIGYGTYVHTYEVNGYNWWQLAQVTQLASAILPLTPSIPVIQAYNMDKKVDDGIPNTGTVQAITVQSSSQTALAVVGAQSSDSATSCYNNVTNVYSIGYNSGNGHNCALSFRFQ
jgi:prepilin-type N-terminal cleavage/methylation domain-containing protein